MSLGLLFGNCFRSSLVFTSRFRVSCVKVFTYHSSKFDFSKPTCNEQSVYGFMIYNRPTLCSLDGRRLGHFQFFKGKC